jgi:hypothetical protein
MQNQISFCHPVCSQQRQPDDVGYINYKGQRAAFLANILSLSVWILPHPALAGYSFVVYYQVDLLSTAVQVHLTL